MAGSTNGAGGSGNNADHIRYQSYLTQMERQHEADVRDKEDAHRERVGRLVSNQEEQSSTIKKDYDVKISQEAETLERKLNMVRERNTVLVKQEQEAGELEVNKLHTQYAQKIEQEKRIGDEQIARLQNYYKKATDELHRQYEKERMKVAQKGKQS